MGQRFSSVGYEEFSYIDVRKIPLSGEPLPFFISTVDDLYNAQYINENLVTFDPIVQKAATTNSPFTWADCPEYHSWKRSPRDTKNRARYVMRFAHDHGYTQGYIIPIHAVDGRGHPASAMVSLFWRDRPEVLNQSISMPAWLRLAAASMHEKMLEFRGLTKGDVTAPALTERERECLLWACRGKTRGETADILSISDRTVEFHFQNAMRKLQVHNKFHAIAMAIHMGLIVP